MASDSQEAIVIVGADGQHRVARAGIIGLDVALVLAERGLGPRITVYAEHLPGDTSPNYTSPWAGCNFSGISGSDKNALRWDKLGYAHLMRLAAERGPEAYVKRTHSVEYWDSDAPRDKIRAISEYLEDFRVIPADELPSGVEYGLSATTVTVNAPKHIEYLFRRLRDQHGVRFVRRRLDSIDAAFASPATRVVFNCTGNGARTLPGVEDSKCFPTRGQVVLVRAPAVKSNVMRHGRGYETYIIPRPYSNGNAILGGYMQKGVFDASTYAHESESIVSRTTGLSSELREGGLEVLAAFAGMRPSREGGTRVEREERRGRALVHNYGAGGTGFQAGYGMALDAVEAADDVLRQLKSDGPRSRL